MPTASTPFLRSAPLAILLALGAAACNPPEVARPGAPDIVLILADDMGFSDIGAFGSEIETPTLDRLAREGLRFSEFRNTPRCVPTRASLLTGQYPHRAGLGHMEGDWGLPGYAGDLNAETVTVAEVLKTAGYRTYMAGKWHVTRQIGEWVADSTRASRHNWPLQRGFDRFYGTITGAGSFFDPNTLTNDNEPVATTPEGYYYTDALSDSASAFIRHHDRTTDAPLFLYAAYTAPHWPLHALPEDIGKYRGRYDAGWDSLRAERYRRLVSMGLIDAEWPLSERDADVPAWDSLSEEERAWYARAMEVYAAQVDRLDRGIGEIVRALEETGRLDNTLLVFLSDNGACDEVLTDEWQGPFLRRQTRSGRKVALGNDDKTVMPGPEETFMSYGAGWANASNTPFRRFKHYTHEGGIASPFVVHWPAGVASGAGREAPDGRIADDRSQLIDLMATFVDVSGAAYPAGRNGVAIAPMAGVSLAPVLRGEALKERPLFFEHEGNRAVFLGDWKLVAEHGQPWSLYRMSDDRTEARDLAASEPERVAELAALYDAWADANYVRPWPVERVRLP